MQVPELLKGSSRFELKTVECPGCGLVWVAPGLIDGDKHECKRCGFQLVIEPVLANGRTESTETGEEE